MQSYSPPTTVIQTVTASYDVPQSNLMTNLKEKAEAEQTNWQFQRDTQLTQINQGGTAHTIILTKQL